MSGSTPRITAAERKKNEEIRNRSEWVVYALQENGDRRYAADPSYCRDEFTTIRGNAKRYLSEAMALKVARQWQVMGDADGSPKYPWITSIGTEQVK